MRKQKTLYEKIEGELKAMNFWMDWQVGVLFNYYKNRVGEKLGRQEVQGELWYDDVKTRYDTMIRGAKNTNLI